MKTLVCLEPGVFNYQEKEFPQQKTGFSIIKIKRIGICGTDLHAFEGTQPYFKYPRILGHELSGELVQTNASGFKAGEHVTITPYYYCGHCYTCIQGKTNCCENLNVCGVHIDGGMCEYLSVPDYALVHGEDLSPDTLALIEPFSIGAHGIRRASVREGEFVLVVGAGPIGMATMEIAKVAGAEVIALDVVESRLNFCKEILQVSHIINGRNESYIEQIKTITHGNMPAVVIDATGNLKAINNSFNLISHGGRYILIGLQKESISFSHPDFHKREATLMSSRNATIEDFDWVITEVKKKTIKPEKYITHRTSFEHCKDQFPHWLNPSNGVIKAMVHLID